MLMQGQRRTWSSGAISAIAMMAGFGRVKSVTAMTQAVMIQEVQLSNIHKNVWNKRVSAAALYWSHLWYSHHLDFSRIAANI